MAVATFLLVIPAKAGIQLFSFSRHPGGRNPICCGKRSESAAFSEQQKQGAGFRLSPE